MEDTLNQKRRNNEIFRVSAIILIIRRLADRIENGGKLGVKDFQLVLFTLPLMYLLLQYISLLRKVKSQKVSSPILDWQIPTFWSNTLEELRSDLYELRLDWKEKGYSRFQIKTCELLHKTSVLIYACCNSMKIIIGLESKSEISKD